MVLPLNPYKPGNNSSIFIPDRLIAGDKKLVTQTGTIAAGQVLYRGAVLGRSTTGTVTSAAKTAGNTGNGTITGVALGIDPIPGTYTITLTSGTAFSVTDATGAVKAPGIVGQPYEQSYVGFQLNAGATAFVAGDGFTITSTAPTGEYLLAVSTATDGSQNPVAILVDATDTSATGTNAATTAGMYIEGEFNANALSFGAGFDAAVVRDALAIRGCHIKFPVSAAPTQY